MFFYLSTALNKQWKILSARELISLNSGIFKFLNLFKKKLNLELLYYFGLHL